MDSPPSKPKPDKRDRRAYNRRYWAKNKERLQGYSRAYQKANKLRLNAQKRARYFDFQRAHKLDYYRRNRQRILQQKRDYYVRKRHIIDAWRARNIDRIRTANRRWHQENRERSLELRRLNSRRRRERPAQRIAGNVRRTIGKWVKRGIKKIAKSEVLLGCSFDEFRRHLERQFRSGMNWNNYGRAWHIDHIIPCSAFDLTQPEQLRRCFHFTNQRPLWARSNMRKGAKVTDPQLKLLL